MTTSPTPDRKAVKTVETRISSVTVYSNQAQVTRRGTVTLTGDEQELEIASLPATLDTDSIRAAGSGTVAVQLLGVRVENAFTTEPVAERSAQLMKQIEQVEAQKRTIQDQLVACQLQLKFVEGLSEKSVGCFSNGLAKQQISLNEAGKLLNFLGQNYKKYTTAIALYQRQQQQLNRQLQAFRKKLQQIQTPRPLENLTVFVGIEPSGSGEFELELSYVVHQASWMPLYDLRINIASKEINLNYLAEVNQKSGENWTDVKLSLSTAKPGLGTLPPKLDPWYIDLFSPSFPRSRNLAGPSPEMSQKAAPLHPYAAEIAEEESSEAFFSTYRTPAGAVQTAIEAQAVTASVSREGGVVAFEVGGNNNIPSDGSPHKITVFQENYPCRFEYIAIPRLVSFAYLQAVVTNPATGATLLPGKANIFRDNTFVGTTQLDNIAPNQEFKLNLGIDEGLKIERHLVERQVEKKLIGNQRRTSYAYRLSIANLREIPTTLILREQLPVSRNEQIKVRLTLTNPKIQAGEMGLLEWSIELGPQAQQEVYYQFVVEHPPELMVTGLDI